MLKLTINILIVFLSIDVSALMVDAFLVKSPPPEFYSKYHKNFYIWLKKTYIKNSDEGLEKCFQEWLNTEEAHSRFFLKDQKTLRPFIISYEKTKKNENWHFTLLSKKNMSCLDGAHGGKWNFQGKLISKFYWEDSQGECSKDSINSVLFEKDHSKKCTLWRLDSYTKQDTKYYGMRSYAKMNIEHGNQTSDLVFFYGFNPYLLNTPVDSRFQDFKWSWKSIIRGVQFKNTQEYKFYLP